MAKLLSGEFFASVAICCASSPSFGPPERRCAPTSSRFSVRACANPVGLPRMGELEPWIDENFIRNLWFQMGEQVNVKMIRDKFSG